MKASLNPSSSPQPQETDYTWNSILLERWLADISGECLQEASRQRLRNAVKLFPLPIAHFPSAVLLLDGSEGALHLPTTAGAATNGPKHAHPLLGAVHRAKGGGAGINDVGAAVVPLAASPFRFANTDTFHQKLREQVEGKDMRVVVERRCHGFSSEGVLAASAASEGQRKRQRQSPPPKTFQQEPPSGCPDPRPRKGVKLNTRTPIAGGQKQDPNFHTLGPLATRIMENDDVLNDLLLGDTSMSSAADSSPYSSSLCPGSSTTNIAFKGNAAANGMPETPPFSLGSSTLKGLRDRCAANGLLTSGTKSDLYHRLMLFKERQDDNLRERLLHQPTNVALPSAVVCPVREGRSARPPEKRSLSPSPPPRFPSPPRPLATSPAFLQLKGLSNRLISTDKGGLSLSSLSPPPKRTVFRYHSRSSEPPPCHAETHAGVDDLATEEGRKMAASTQDGVILGRGLEPCRRIVPAPDFFIRELLKDPQRSSAPQLRARDRSKKPIGLPGRVTSQGEVLAGKSVATEGLRWQWLVDTRERVRGKHDGMLAMLQRQQVSCASYMLPCGDFMLNIDVDTSKTEESTAQYACSSFGQNSRTGVNDDMTSALPRDSPQPMSPRTLPQFSHLCSLVVERKTAADLDASIKSTRYLEQRNLLIQSQFQLVVWLIEGSELPSGRGGRCGNGLPSTVNVGKCHFNSTQRDPLWSSQQHDKEGVGEENIESRVADKHGSLCGIESAFSSLVPEGQRRVYSACMSLTHQPGFCVVRTRTLQESVAFLKQLGAAVTHQVATTLASGSLLGVGNSSSTTPLPPHFPSLLPTMSCLQLLQKLQKSLRAQTAFPRMLMCIRGCSSALAQTLFNKYGSFYGLWKELQQRGALACDVDGDIVKLSVSQKKVFVLLTEFIMSREYY